MDQGITLKSSTNRWQNFRKTVENHGAKLTVMAEVGQQWAHQRIAAHEAWAQEVVEAWESILRETIKNQHDIQLHLHPQWLNAEYKNNRWHVDLSQWEIASLPSETIANTLKEGKIYLDNLLKPVDPSYECIAFRAGAYCIEPSKVVIQNLVKVGILCDTSVTKGMYNLPFFDYRDAYSHFWPWFASPDNVKYKSNQEGGLLEIPIYSYKTIDSPIFRKFISLRLFYLICFGALLSKQDQKWLSERNKKQFQRYPLQERPLMIKNTPSLKWLLSKFIAKASIQLDYDVLPPTVFTRCMQGIFKNRSIREYSDKETIIPVMASGHVKQIHDCGNIDRILNEVHTKLKEKVIYWTLSDAIAYWIKEKPVSI